MALNKSTYRPPGEETRKPPLRRSLGKLLSLPVILGLLLAVILIASIRRRVERFFPMAEGANIHSAVTVWADKESGSYYCAGNVELERHRART